MMESSTPTTVESRGNRKGQVKKLIAVSDRGTALFRIKYENGGELPQELTGTYTSKGRAEDSINKYLTKKNRTNGTSTSK